MTVGNRVIVFGSRNWAYPSNVWARLATLPRDTLIVHGDCPTGADAAADDFCRENGYRCEKHPALWRIDGRLDRSAGPRRNHHMAELGAVLAIGFRMPGKSSGTDNMWGECELQHIPVERHGWDWPRAWGSR